MMITPIINGTIDPAWVLIILASAVAFFVIRTLNKIESRIENQDKRSKIITNVLLQMLTRLGGDDKFYQDLSGQLNKEQ